MKLSIISSNRRNDHRQCNSSLFFGDLFGAAPSAKRTVRSDPSSVSDDLPGGGVDPLFGDPNRYILTPRYCRYRSTRLLVAIVERLRWHPRGTSRGIYRSGLTAEEDSYDGIGESCVT